MQHNTSNVTPIARTQNTNNRPTKPLPTHDTILGTIRKNRRTMVLQLMKVDEPVKGFISQFDKYTITLTHVDENGREYKKTYYKHAIESFTTED